VQRGMDTGISRMILAGTFVKESRNSIPLAKTWYSNRNNNGGNHKQKSQKNLFCSVGIHPHDAKSFEAKDSKTIDEMRASIQANKLLIVAVGECGLDFDRNFSTNEDQILVFQQQFLLAM
jgi:TatD DNase family protein